MEILELIISMSKYIFAGIPVLLLLGVGLGSLQVNTGKEKSAQSRRKKLRKVRKYLWLVGLISILYMGCYVCVILVQNRVTGQIKIGFNYAEASRGLNPNSTRFNTYDIINDDVLNQAIAEGGLGDITPEQLRETLSVEPVQTGENLSSEQYYVATDYLLRYASSKETLRLSGRNVVASVAKAYHDQFNKKYSRKTNVLEMDFSGFEELDYLDQVNLLRQRATDVQNYLWMVSDESKLYTAEDGETFASLATKVSDFQNVELEGVESFILTRGVSRDKEQQILKLEYVNMIQDMSRQKHRAAYDVLLETIDMYERDMASIVLVPTMDNNGEYYMSRTKIGVDDFADSAEQYSQAESNIQTTIMDNQYAINQLELAQSSADSFGTADEMMEEAKNALEAFSQKGISMLKDYETKTKGEFLVFVEAGSPFKSFGFWKRCFLFGTELFCALAISLFLMPEKRTKKKEKGEAR